MRNCRRRGIETTDTRAHCVFGGHKGSAISTMIELLAGVMIGDLTSPEARDALGIGIAAQRVGMALCK